MKKINQERLHARCLKAITSCKTTAQLYTVSQYIHLAGKHLPTEYNLNLDAQWYSKAMGLPSNGIIQL